MIQFALGVFCGAILTVAVASVIAGAKADKRSKPVDLFVNRRSPL